MSEAVGSIISFILIVFGIAWFLELFNKEKKSLKTKNPEKLLEEAVELFEYDSYSNPKGRECLLKAMKYGPDAKNPFNLYEHLGQVFFRSGEEDLMHKCFDIAKKYYVPYSEEELYVKNGKLRRRRKKGY